MPTTLALGAFLWLADGAAGLVVALAMTALCTAGLLGAMSGRGGSTAAATSAVAAHAAADDDAGAPDDVTERLRRLHDDHVEQVNMAVAEERFDLVQELSDSYMDEALRLITAGARPLHAV